MGEIEEVGFENGTWISRNVFTFSSIYTVSQKRTPTLSIVT